jgi:hypothetical protein
MNNTNITVQLSPLEYGHEEAIAEAFVKKKFGFQLIIDNSTESSKKIFNLEQIKKLKESIDEALEAYDTLMNFKF